MDRPEAIIYAVLILFATASGLANWAWVRQAEAAREADDDAERQRIETEDTR